MNPSVIFLNGPEIEEKRKLVAKLKNQFKKQVCICINRKELIQMMKGDQDLDDQSYEWMIPKMLKSLLNNGVSVVFDAFLPTRRSQQYISLMKGLPCYWIGVFFDQDGEESGDYYDFSVHFQGDKEISEEDSCALSADSSVAVELVVDTAEAEEKEPTESEEVEKTEEESAESEICDESEDDDIEALDAEETEEEPQDDVIIDEIELKAMEIFAFIMKHQPSCFNVEHNAEVTAEKREIGGRDFQDSASRDRGDREDRPRRDFADRGSRDGDRGERSFNRDRGSRDGDRGGRSFGGSRDGGERRSFGDRPRPSFGGDRGSRDGGERKSFGDRPRPSFGGDRGSRDGGERRSFGDRPRPSFGGDRGGRRSSDSRDGGGRGRDSSPRAFGSDRGGERTEKKSDSDKS